MQSWLEGVNSRINAVVWGVPMLVLILGTGLYLSIRTGFFQIKNFKYVIKNTIFAAFKNKDVRENSDKGALSQFQTVSTALAGCIGTGNIAGVATAITLGGPGAVFWMWISAILGMMTLYSENVLGIKYRKRDKNGNWKGGTMYYLENAFSNRKIGGRLAIFFSFCCIFASFGVGNMVQVNSICEAMKTSFNVNPLICGVILAIICGFIIFGGFKTLGRVAERIVPITALLYILGCAFVIIVNFKNIIPAFGIIFKSAFGFAAVGGGFAGASLSYAITYGLKRGVFSNEAGLGSTAIINSVSNVDNPVSQGMWGIFQVFFDTIVVCSLSALVILTSGCVDLSTGNVICNLQGVALVNSAFETALGRFAGAFVSVAMILFAFTTVIGWSYYGEKCWEYIGEKRNKNASGAALAYRIFYIALILVASQISLHLVWEMADTFNGLMAIPNLIGVLSLSGEVAAITKAYKKTHKGL